MRIFVTEGGSFSNLHPLGPVGQQKPVFFIIVNKLFHLKLAKKNLSKLNISKSQRRASKTTNQTSYKSTSQKISRNYRDKQKQYPMYGNITGSDGKCFTRKSGNDFVFVRLQKFFNVIHPFYAG